MDTVDKLNWAQGIQDCTGTDEDYKEMSVGLLLAVNSYLKEVVAQANALAKENYLLKKQITELGGKL